MGVMDGGEIKLVENKVIKIVVVVKLHNHKNIARIANAVQVTICLLVSNSISVY